MKMNLPSKGSLSTQSCKPIILILFLFASLYSCGVEEKTINDFGTKLQTFIAEDEIEKYKAIVLLPGEGCSGCISSTEKFIKTLETKDQVKVIFTVVRSLKILKLKLNLDLEAEHFLVDKDNVFNQGRTYSIYPTVFHIEHGNIYDFDYVSPNSNYDLKSLLID